MRTTDIAIIGAGPAGLTAALAAAEAGRRVTLIDENASAGGSLRFAIGEVAGESTRGYHLAQQLADQVVRAGVEIALQSVAWGLFEDHIVTVSDAHRSYRLQADAIILATGATDATIPFPGWELPGVMTATAFLRAVVLHRVVPGRAIVVVGHGVEANVVRSTCNTLGLSVVAEARTTAEVQVIGQECITHVVVGGRQVPADSVVLAIGRRPDPELALHVLCAIGYAESSLSQVPRRTQTLMTSISGVYAVGDCAGLCSLEEAFAEGRVAGYAACGSDRLTDALARLAASRSVQRAAELNALLLD